MIGGITCLSNLYNWRTVSEMCQKAMNTKTGQKKRALIITQSINVTLKLFHFISFQPKDKLQKLQDDLTVLQPIPV